jgi:hypothetical protein
LLVVEARYDRTQEEHGGENGQDSGGRGFKPGCVIWLDDDGVVLSRAIFNGFLNLAKGETRAIPTCPAKLSASIQERVKEAEGGG